MGSLTTVRGLGRISMCTSVSYEIGRLGFGGDSVTSNAAVVYISHTKVWGCWCLYWSLSDKECTCPVASNTVPVVQLWLHDSICLI